MSGVKALDLSCPFRKPPFSLVQWQRNCITVDDHGIIRRRYDYRAENDIITLLLLLKYCGVEYKVPVAALTHVRKFYDKPFKDLVQFFKEHGAERRDERERYNAERERWTRQVDSMSNIIIGIDHIDFYDRGFHLWMLLNSLYTRAEQLEHLNLYRHKALAFAIEELRVKKKAGRKKAIDLLPFVKVTSVVVTSQNLLHYTFELKDEVQQALEECHNAQGKSRT